MAKKSLSVRGATKKPSGILKVEDFKYYDQLGLTLPQLILGIEVNPKSEYSRDYKFKPGRKWIKLAHQTAGHACNQRYLICTALQPKSVEVLQKMQQLANKWDGSQAGCWGNSLDSLNEYRQDIKNLFGADCNFCHNDFEEGIYPIDIDFLIGLTDEKVPENLDDLVEWESGWDRSLGCLGRWKLFVLGENCD
jgi:hypothetical protein